MNKDGYTALIYNDPAAYAELVLAGNVKGYLDTERQGQWIAEGRDTIPPFSCGQILFRKLGKELLSDRENLSLFHMCSLEPPIRESIDSIGFPESLKAENEVKKAEAQAKIAIAQAEGEAKALKIKADGEAYYNRTVAASLNALLVQQYALERWDGKLPVYTGGNNIPMINLNTTGK